MSKTSNNNSIFKVIAASSVGTLIEWYDFYIFGSLAFIISGKFFPQDNPTAAFLSTLATFAAGFVVRPFGALVFGRLGDLIGRKYTFMLTLLLMGGATFLIGCVPSYDTIGYWAPFLVLVLRLLQGLALGGEYGGAATYVAEHAPANRRGYYTSWIQTTATAGLFISLMVILITKSTLSADAFDAWGWRVPFWVSVIMVFVSYIIRQKMHESPLFAKAKAEGKIVKNPLKESFGNKYNLKFVLLALFGAVMGQGVIWYTGQFYAMNFIQKVCNVNSIQTDSLVAIALLMATPFFVVFGGLSDKIGRKSIMLAGMLLAVLTYRPIYKNIFEITDIAAKTELADKRTVTNRLENKEDKTIIHYQFLSYYEDGTIATKDSVVTINTVNKAETVKTGYSIQLDSGNKWKLIWLVFIQVIYVTMVYGPIAAFLVEMFPVNIRYTSMSLPYHVGNGIFGGLLPMVATYLVTKAQTSGSPDWYLNGLWYPIIIAGISFVIGLVYLSRKNRQVHD
ncbi:MFS transporter [Polluticaenibacter yanchengensis]|uniref:MFS transporter n=1 Tax=Polluticaenibacter yanchengensis TaxID=3014562 RepID=A0ABT4UJE7_9BACT|nr:MFS transporter [Chitinophagaceae bacterium LY-5]